MGSSERAEQAAGSRRLQRQRQLAGVAWSPPSRQHPPVSLCVDSNCTQASTCACAGAEGGQVGVGVGGNMPVLLPPRITPRLAAHCHPANAGPRSTTALPCTPSTPTQPAHLLLHLQHPLHVHAVCVARLPHVSVMAQRRLHALPPPHVLHSRLLRAARRRWCGGRAGGMSGVPGCWPATRLAQGAAPRRHLLPAQPSGSHPPSRPSTHPPARCCPPPTAPTQCRAQTAGAGAPPEPPARSRPPRTAPPR